LKTLDELPTLPEIKALIEPIEAELAGAGPEYLEGPRVEFPGDRSIGATDAAANDATEEVDAARAEPER
jgi:hypothetical protein